MPFAARPDPPLHLVGLTLLGQRLGQVQRAAPQASDIPQDFLLEFVGQRGTSASCLTLRQFQRRAGCAMAQHAPRVRLERHPRHAAAARSCHGTGGMLRFARGQGTGALLGSGYGAASCGLLMVVRRALRGAGGCWSVDVPAVLRVHWAGVRAVYFLFKTFRWGWC